MSNVLFVYPFFLKNSALERDWMMPYFPLGVLYLAGAVRQAGHNVAVFDGTFAESHAEFSQMLADIQPDVVCIASLITLRPVALELAQVAAGAGAQIIFGGADPTAHPMAYLDIPRAIVVQGEAELTLVELLDVLGNPEDLNGVQGIAYRKDDILHQTPQRKPIADIDSLPYPARDLLDAQPYLDTWRDAHGYTSLTLAVSRGCPYGCDYCAQSAVGPHFRLRSPQAVAREIKELEAAYAPDSFRLVDDLEGIGQAWLVELGNAMLAAGIHTPYEGLQSVSFKNLPMYRSMKGLCGKRNRYIPTQNNDLHAPPALSPEILQERWGEGILPENG